MGGELLVLFEMVLVFGLLLGFAIWQLRSVSKAQRQRKLDSRETGSSSESDDSQTGA